MATLFDNLERMIVGTETVTYTNKLTGGDATDTVNYALRRALTRTEVQTSGGFFTYQDIAWNLPVAELSATAPQEGDTITAGSEIWSVLTIEKLRHGTRWRMVCRKQV